MRLPSALALLLAAALLAGCGGSEVSQAEYQSEVVKARNRVDFALGRVATSQTFDQVKARLAAAASETRAASEQLDEAGAPDGLGDEADELVASLAAFADELDATSEGLDEMIGQNLGRQLEGFSFETWQDVQAALEALRGEGVRVPALELKTGAG